MVRNRYRQQLKELIVLTVDLVEAIKNANYQYIVSANKLTTHMTTAISNFEHWRKDATNR